MTLVPAGMVATYFIASSLICRCAAKARPSASPAPITALSGMAAEFTKSSSRMLTALLAAVAC